MKFSFWSWNNGLSRRIKVLKIDQDLQDERNESLRKKTKWLIITLAALVKLSSFLKYDITIATMNSFRTSNTHDISSISLSQENFDDYDIKPRVYTMTTRDKDAQND